MSIFSSKKKNGKVLIVEDDGLLAQVLGESFTKAGFEVIVVTNGLEVMDAVKTNHPHIIMLDLILPGIDGFEVLKQLKSDEKTKSTPVIVMSNLDDAGDIKSIKVLGAEEYFIKAHTQLDTMVQFAMRTLK